MTQESKNVDKINTYTMVDVTGKVTKISETSKKNHIKLTVVDINDRFFSVFIPPNLEIIKYTTIRVAGNYSSNESDGNIYHNIFLSNGRKGHALHIISESENLLETP